MSSGDAFSQFAPMAPSTLITGNAKPLKSTQVPESGASTWANFQPIKYQYQDAMDPRDYHRKMAQKNNPLVGQDPTWDGQNIGKPGQYSPNNRVTQEIQQFDPKYSNSWVKQAEQLMHRGLTEMGSSGFANQLQKLANVGQVQSILSMLQGGMAGGGGSGGGDGSTTGAGGNNANGQPGGEDMTNVVSQWTTDAQNAAQNQNNAQQNGQYITWDIDITKPNAIPLTANAVANVISNTANVVASTANSVINSLTVPRGPS